MLKTRRAAFQFIVLLFIIRKMRVQNKQAVVFYFIKLPFVIQKHYVQNKRDSFCNTKNVFSKQVGLLFSLLIINKYYTPKMFLL